MSVRRRSSSAVPLLAVLCVTSCFAATQQQQHQQQQLSTLSATNRDEVLSFVAQTVRDELQPLVSKLESRIDNLDSRLQMFDSRLDVLHGRWMLLDSRVDEITVRLLGNSRNPRLDSQRQTQDESQPTQDETDNDERSRLDVLLNKTVSQQTVIAELAVRLDQMEKMTNLRFRDCSELPIGATTGKYILWPAFDRAQSPIEAFCDMETDGGRWTVFQRRDDIQPRQDFYLGWTDYKYGFGNLTGEFWWGLNFLWQLTSTQERQYELRIDLEHFDGSKAYAVYQAFRISSEEEGYTLTASNYSGDAGHSFSENIGWKFTTRDRDQDSWYGANCANLRQGAWWYGDSHFNCGESNLNGRYLESGKHLMTGIWWMTWKAFASLKKTEMKIRPR